MQSCSSESWGLWFVYTSSGIVERKAKRKEPVSVALNKCTVNTRIVLRTLCINLPSTADLLKELTSMSVDRNWGQGQSTYHICWQTLDLNRDLFC